MVSHVSNAVQTNLNVAVLRMTYSINLVLITANTGVGVGDLTDGASLHKTNGGVHAKSCTYLGDLAWEYPVDRWAFGNQCHNEQNWFLQDWDWYRLAHV
jgi:hypothetical protein